MQPLRSLVTGAAALALLATPAQATLGFGLRAGFLDREEEDGRPRSFGGFARAHSGFFGLEVGADRWTFERADGAEVTTTPVSLALLAYPLPFAYVLGGGGRYDASIAETGGTGAEASGLSWLIGAGLEIPVLPALRLTGDIRYGYVDRDRDRLAQLGLDDRDWVIFHAGAMLALPPGAP